jgi:protein CpxP
MSKTRFLGFTVVVLILLNLATLGFLVFSGPKRHHPEQGGRLQPQEIIIEKLHLDANQQKKYQELIHLHRNEINELDKKMQNSKQELYLLLTKPDIDTKVKDSLFTVLGNYQKQIETTHFNHFQDIKKICNQEQQKDFDELTFELARIFQNSKQPK